MDYTELIELMKRARSFRRFREDDPVSREVLVKIVEAARYCPSGRNLQPLVYRPVSGAECEEVFPLLGWAGYLKEWAGPEKGERPTAYIIQCLDTDLTSDPMCDDGLQLEALTLAAASLGLGGCIIKSFSPVKLAQALGIDERFRPLHVVALGRPAERVVMETLEEGSRDGDATDIYYWRDSEGTHHVPKRPIADMMI